MSKAQKVILTSCIDIELEYSDEELTQLKGDDDTAMPVLRGGQFSMEKNTNKKHKWKQNIEKQKDTLHKFKIFLLLEERPWLFKMLSVTVCEIALLI